MTNLAERYQAIRDRIARAAQAANRDPADITLVVVTKNHPVDLAHDLYQLGARDFGENRDQEASVKAEALRLLLEPGTSDYRWHFIGQLQSNKVKSVLEYASVIHSLDRESLLKALIKEVGIKRQTDSNFELDAFIQVNLTDNPERGGIQEKDLLAFADRVVATEGLRLRGVMAVGSLENTPEHDFALVLQLSEQLRRQHPTANQISAGMSEDFEIAIGFGATHLRVGTAITGKRDYNL